MHDQSNLNRPVLGQQLPVYPALLQVVRVTGAAVTANVYPCIVQQVSVLTLRDREDSYVLDCNASGLGLGYYNARLVGIYNSKPLYAVGGTASGSGSITVINNVVYNNVGTIILPEGSDTSASGNVLTIKSIPGYDINEWKESGQWYTSNNDTGLGTGFAINADTLYGIPVIVDSVRTVQAIGFELRSAGSAGALASMALYDVGGPNNILPRLPVIQLNDVDVDTPVPPIVLSGGSNTWRATGLYWLLWVGNQGTSITNLAGGPVPTVLPCIDDGGGTLQQIRWLASGVGAYPYTNVWPATPFALTDGINHVGESPALFWKLA